MDKRLQFRHHNEVFETRNDAVEYIKSNIRFTDSGLAASDKTFGFSLLGEPTVLLYKNEKDETDPHLMLVIGSQTNTGAEGQVGQYSDNRFCIIDIDKTQSEVSDLEDEIQKVTSALSLATQDTNTLHLEAKKTEDGTVLSGEVLVPQKRIIDDIRRPNVILPTDEGLFTYINLDYNEESGVMTFTVNGEKKDFNLGQYTLKSGEYKKEDESLHLVMSNGNEVVVSFEELIDEWTVEGIASSTPVVLTKQRVGYGLKDEEIHKHGTTWQDVLKADVRIAETPHNILEKTSDGMYLNVRGTADNIKYFNNGEEITVSDALNECYKHRVSCDNGNMIYTKADGIFANARMRYDNKKNTIYFTVSTVDGEERTESFELNTVNFFDHISYNPTTETLDITYVDAKGEIKVEQLPIGQWLTDWEWDIVNDGHSVELHKQRVVNGNDKVSADVKVAEADDNILTTLNHTLYVKGTSDNIKHNNTSLKLALDTIDAEISNISGSVETSKSDIAKATETANTAKSKADNVEASLAIEVERSKSEDEKHDNEIKRLSTTIGDAFTTDAHETVSYKFNEISTKLDETKSTADTVKSDLSDYKLSNDKAIGDLRNADEATNKRIDDVLGGDFSITNTVSGAISSERAEREANDEKLAQEVDTIKKSLSTNVDTVTNKDHSIDVDNTDKANPIISLNISSENIGGAPNLVRLNNDGIGVYVDLSYDDSTKQLTFSTSNGSTTYDLSSTSIVDEIYYNQETRTLVVLYHTDKGDQKKVEIPVAALIDDWYVSDGSDGALSLTKYKNANGQTVLSGEVIVHSADASHEDNILINDHGALYVPGKGITENAEKLSKLADTVSELGSKVTDEIARSTEEDKNLASSINSLSDKLEAETTRATEKEKALDDKISENAASIKSLGESLQAEKEERINDYNELVGEISSVTSSYTASINAERERALGAESALRESISNVKTNLEAEVSRATGAETSLDTDIKLNSNAISAEETRARNAEKSLSDDLSAETNRAVARESELESLITVEKSAAREAEKTLQGNIDTLSSTLAEEKANRISGDEALSKSIKDEADRAQSAESKNANAILDETNRSKNVESALTVAINAEETRATLAETNLKSAIDAEVTRATLAENTSSTQLAKEIADRKEEDEKLKDLIKGVTDEFVDTTSIAFTKSEGSGKNVYKAEVKIANSDTNIISLKSGEGAAQGIYATVSLEYNAATNEIKAVGQNGRVLSSAKLGAGSIIDNISYDGDQKVLIFTYHTTEGQSHTINVPVNDLFNEWIVDNKAEGAALELTKTINSTEGKADTLTGRVLITNGEENLIQIKNNGLYVDGRSIANAEDNIECLTNELKQLENAIGVKGNCDDTINYPKTDGPVLSGATSFADADKKLEDALKNVKFEVDVKNTATVEMDSTNASGSNQYEISSNVKLSKGLGGKDTTDNDLYIISDDNPSSEYTNTNVLHIVDFTKEGKGFTADLAQNGLYLSNVWDCGEYTKEGEGINHQYRIDDSNTASNFYDRKFSNSARKGTFGTV